MMRKRTLAYWWRGQPNFGDLLTAPLLKHFCNIDVDSAPFETATLIGSGSILEHIPNGWTGRVVGAGKLYEDSLFPIGPQILALRGPLSAKGLRGDFALGDLGLLASELVSVDTKHHELGIVPHWSDEALASDPRFAQYAPVIIDPRAPPLEVIRKIGECRKIISSSLHGIILADAFGIPRRLEYAPRFDHEGKLFKFRDYMASIRGKVEVGKTTQANRTAVDDRKAELYDVVRAIVP